MIGQYSFRPNMMVVSGDSPPDPKLDQYYGSRGFGNLDYEGLSARLGPKKIPSLGLTFSWAVFPLLWIRRFICYAGSCLLGSVMVYELQLVSFFFFSFFFLFSCCLRLSSYFFWLAVSIGGNLATFFFQQIRLSSCAGLEY